MKTSTGARPGPTDPVPVCLISSSYDPGSLSGVGVCVAQERKGLARMGYDVHVIGAGSAPDDDGGTTRIASSRKLFPFAAVIAYLRVRRRRPPRIIHGHETSGAWVALAARLERAFLGRGPRVVTTMHVSFLRQARALRRNPGGRTPLREWILKWIDGPIRYLEGILAARLSDSVVAVSRSTSRDIAADYLGGAGRLLRVANGVDPVRFHPGAGRGALRRELGLEGDTVILYAGGFRGHKGVEFLLHAFAGIAGRHPRARLLLAGDGPRDYTRLLCALGIRERTWILPRRPHEEMPRVYGAAHILCLPSLYESFGLVALEAMACGLPVIGSRTGGIPEIVRQGETGILVEPGRVAPLVRALDLLLGRPGLRKRMGDEGRRVAQESYPWSRTAKSYGEVFRRVGVRIPGGGP